MKEKRNKKHFSIIIIRLCFYNLLILCLELSTDDASGLSPLDLSTVSAPALDWSALQRLTRKHGFVAPVGI